MVSDELREAMGISHDEIPNHVYRLHEIGYPPSYLNALIDESMKMGDNSRGIIEQLQCLDTLIYVHDL